MRIKTRFERVCGTTAALALMISLAACGGGGGGGGGGGYAGVQPSSPVASKPPGDAGGSNAIKASCNSCGAVDNNTYSGTGTGIWQGVNASQVPMDMPLSIAGLNGQSVTLVLTNEGNSAEALSGLAVHASAELATTANKATIEPHDVGDYRSAIDEFNRNGFAKLLDPQAKVQPSILKSMAPLASYALNDQRSIYLYDHTQRTVKLAATRATGDGTTVNLWVEARELSPTAVSDALVSRMLDKFAASGGIYDMLVRVGGPLWGDHGMAQLLPGNGQPVDIFIVNFDYDRQPYGLVGYFWGLNNFKKGSGDLTYSNESLSLYLDSESLYLDGESGVKQIETVMAHEGMHMQNFYRRGVKMGADATFDTWLEEMSALMMEDWASFNIDPTHNAIRDSRYPHYLSYNGAGSYNCGLTEWTPMGATCESYSVTGSFGGFLNRQFGLDFYKSLLNSPGGLKSADILDKAIKARRPDSSIGQELRRFTAASAGLIALDAGIAEYSMPARSEDVFTLPAIDPASLGRANRKLPQAAPQFLQALASFPVIRPNIAGTYSEVVRVPPGSTLSVVVN